MIVRRKKKVGILGYDGGELNIMGVHLNGTKDSLLSPGWLQ